MTFTQVRNHLIAKLEKYLGCPIILSEQISEQLEYPYCYYSVLSPRNSARTFALRELLKGNILVRSEPVTATMSFTFCSQDRLIDDRYIFGEDEALEFAEKALNFFLLNSHELHTPGGNIVVRIISDISNRSSFLVENTVRRYGFDVKLAYTRTDTTEGAAIEIVGIKHKK